MPKALIALLLLCACQKEPTYTVPCYSCTTVVTVKKLNGIESRGVSVFAACGWNEDSAQRWEREQTRGDSVDLYGWVWSSMAECRKQ
jgi:hypothetical protein